jgi:hypothetical protein
MKRNCVVALFAICLPLCCAKDAFRVTPATAFLSPTRYTNAFFGFCFPLPKDPAFHIARVSSSGRELYLFGLAQEKGLTVLAVSAQQMNDKDAELLMMTAPRTLVYGKEFSKAKSHQKKDRGTVWKTMYLTAIDGYLLEFNIQSFDRNLAEELERCAEETRFFDPTKARAVAGANGRAYNPALSNPLGN